MCNTGKIVRILINYWDTRVCYIDILATCMQILIDYAFSCFNIFLYAWFSGLSCLPHIVFKLQGPPGPTGFPGINGEAGPEGEKGNIVSYIRHQYCAYTW